MATTHTTLAAALSSSALDLIATAATGATVGGLVRVDDEYMVVTEIIGTTISVRARGEHGTTAAAHNVLAPLTFCLVSDLSRPKQNRFHMVSYGANGAIAVPTSNTIVLLTKATAAAMTLADPSPLADGTLIGIVNTTAVANTVTLATAYTGSTETVFTFTNTVGASLWLIAYKGVWAHVSVSLTAAEGAGAAVADP